MFRNVVYGLKRCGAAAVYCMRFVLAFGYFGIII